MGQERVDNAATQLLIELAFLVPKDTDLNRLSERLVEYKAAVEKRSREGQKEIIEATLKFIYKHQHQLGGTAEVCNLWEQLHTLLGCEECSHRWEGTKFVGASL